jgi:hypothetical protein
MRHACRILVENVKRRGQLEDQDINGILKWILNRVGCVGWIDLAQDRDQWQVLVNM